MIQTQETEEIPKVKKEQSTFVLLAGRDSSLDFYIEAITHESLQNKRSIAITVI